MAACSLYDYRGNKQLNIIKEKLKKDQIKGGIVISEKGEVKHYSS